MRWSIDSRWVRNTWAVRSAVDTSGRSGDLGSRESSCDMASVVGLRELPAELVALTPARYSATPQ